MKLTPRTHTTSRSDVETKQLLRILGITNRNETNTMSKHIRIVERRNRNRNLELSWQIRLSCERFRVSAFLRFSRDLTISDVKSILLGRCTIVASSRDPDIVPRTCGDRVFESSVTLREKVTYEQDPQESNAPIWNLRLDESSHTTHRPHRRILPHCT